MVKTVLPELDKITNVTRSKKKLNVYKQAKNVFTRHQYLNTRTKRKNNEI